MTLTEARRHVANNLVPRLDIAAIVQDSDGQYAVAYTQPCLDYQRHHYPDRIIEVYQWPSLTPIFTYQSHEFTH